MSAKSCIAGTLRLVAPIKFVGGAFAIGARQLKRVRHQLTILEHVLHAYGPFRLDRNLRPCEGAFAVKVMATKATAGVPFDDAAFCAFVYQLNRAITDAGSALRHSAGAPEAVDAIASRMARDPTTIHSAVNSLLAHSGGLDLINERGEKIALVSPTPDSPAEDETVDVAEVRQVTCFSTETSSYSMDSTRNLTLRRGDRIQVVDGDRADMAQRYLAADAAIPVTPPSPPDLFD